MDEKSHRITFVLSKKQSIELKIMCVLTNKTLSNFIRSAIQDKIKSVKDANKLNN